MSSSQNQSQPNGQAANPDILGLIYLAANVLATTVAVFIRRGFGREALALNSLIALILLYVLSASEGRAFLVFAGLFLLAQIWRRIETFRLLRRGAVLHSRYPGYPYWAMQIPFVKSESVAKELVEPVFCFIIGILLCPVSVGVGGYLVLCGFGFIVRHCIDDALARKRIERMRDATIEHQWYSDEMRR
jgi:uncharacterized membrane protein YqaE (UPF0057 family)